MFRHLLVVTTIVLASTQVAASDLHHGRLRNGITYILEEDRTSPIVAVTGCFRETGSLEAREDSGLSHFFEHLVLRGGTARQPEDDWPGELRKIAVLNAVTGQDATCFSLQTQGRHLQEALDLYSDAIFSLEIADAKVDRERGVVFQELDRGRDQPLAKAWAPMLGAAFERHPYGTMTIGDDATLRAASADTFRRIRKESFTPDRFVLAAVGDFESTKLVSLLSRTMGTYPAGSQTAAERPIEPRQAGYREVSTASDVSRAYIVAGFKVPPAYREEAVVLEVLATLLTEGATSRLQKALVATGVAEKVKANANLGRDPGLLVIEIEADPLTVESALEGLWEELRRLATDGPSSDEVIRARQSLMAAFAAQQESAARRAHNLASAEVGSSFVLLSSYPARLASVDTAVVGAVAQRFLSPERCTLALVHPTGQLIEGRALAERVQLAWPSAEQAVADGAKVVRSVLANGVVAVLQTRQGSRTQALHLAFQGEADASALAERVIPQLVDRSSGVSLREGIEALGGRLISSSNLGRLELSFSVPLERFSKAVEILASALSTSTVTRAQLREIEHEMAGQLDSRKDNPRYLVKDNLFKSLFPGTGSAPSTVQMRDGEVVQQFLFRNASPAGIVAASVGGLSYASLLETLESSLGALPVQRSADTPTREYRPASAAGEMVVEREQRQVMAMLGAPAVRAADPDYWPLQLAVRTLFSRLFRRFLRDEGVAYQMVAELEPGFESRPVTITFGVAPGQFEQVYAGVMAELRRLLDEPLPEAELDSVRDRLVLRHSLALDTNLDRAARYARWDLVGLNYDSVDRLHEILSPIGVARVRAVAERYLRPDQFFLSRVGNVHSAQADSPGEY